MSSDASSIKAVLFDWGDTVMRVFPRCPGAMAHWPHVEATDGVGDALATLHGRYRLAMITNAADSDEALVREALRRVALNDFFDVVLTARELGVHKPDPAFFSLAAQVAGCRPEEAVMVGDDYRADIAGARRAGLRTVWYNPGGVPLPTGAEPPDTRIASMSELVPALERLAGGKH